MGFYNSIFHFYPRYISERGKNKNASRVDCLYNVLNINNQCRKKRDAEHVADDSDEQRGLNDAKDAKLNDVDDVI